MKFSDHPMGAIFNWVTADGNDVLVLFKEILYKVATDVHFYF
jgi:hypothetical protein